MLCPENSCCIWEMVVASRKWLLLVGRLWGIKVSTPDVLRRYLAVTYQLIDATNLLIRKLTYHLLTTH